MFIAILEGHFYEIKEEEKVYIYIYIFFFIENL